MYMKIAYIKNKGQLNNFVGSRKMSQFLQSYEWGEFQEKVSGKVFRIGVEDEGKLVAAATIIKKQLPMGKSYFYCPRGPIVNYQLTINNYESIFENLFEEIKRIAKEEGAMFLRFDPPSAYKLKAISYKLNKTIDVQPSKTLVLDLTKLEDDLLINMRQKTRYNIRLAGKKGVKIIEADIKYFDSFWKLLAETTDRDKFRSHGQDYYTEMLKINPNFIKLYVAEYEGKIIAANIISFFGDTVVYMHGASSHESRNVMAPYLLQWYVIRQSKARGFKYYDFYGIDEKKWPGVTRFKKGFSGNEIDYPGTFDLIFDSGWYNIYKMVRRARRTF